MVLVASTVPSPIARPWRVSNSRGGLAQTTLIVEEASATYYLQNTLTVPIAVAVGASALDNFKVEVFDNCTFTGSTLADGINPNRAYSTDDVNSPLRIYTEATGVALGSAIWTWHGVSGTPLQLFGKNSVSTAYLVLAGSAKAAITVTPSSGGTSDISPADWDMELATVTEWPDHINSPNQTKVLGSPSGSGSKVLHLTSNSSYAQVKPLTVPTFIVGRTYTISHWGRGSWYQGDVYFRTNARFYTPDGYRDEINGFDNTWRFRTREVTVIAGKETELYLECYKASGPADTNTYAEFDEVKVLEHVVIPVTIDLSYTLWDGSLLGDV